VNLITFRNGCLLGILCGYLFGCGRHVDINVRTTACLNPPDHFCEGDGSNSRLLEIWVYQLDEYVDPTSLDWHDLVESGKDLQILRSYLTNPEKETMVKTVVTMQRNDHRVFRFNLLKGTRFLLMVAAGRHAGDQSIVITDLHRSKNDEAIIVEQYDIGFPLERRGKPTTAASELGGSR